MATAREEQTSSPGEWPVDFPLDEGGNVEEGLIVWSRLAIIEGRTTGNRQRCKTIGCPGWFIGVNWESENATRFPCSKGWTYDPATKTIRITARRRDLSSHRVTARNGSDAPMRLA